MTLGTAEAGTTLRASAPLLAPLEDLVRAAAREMLRRALEVGCGQEREKTVLPALVERHRESTAAWAEVVRALWDRGLAAPLVAVGDGNLGTWAALAEVFPSTRLRAACEQRRDAYVARQRQHAAADTSVRDWEDVVTFFDFPVELWGPLRTSNPIELGVASVRLRTHLAKRRGTPKNALLPSVHARAAAGADLARAQGRPNREGAGPAR